MSHLNLPMQLANSLRQAGVHGEDATLVKKNTTNEYYWMINSKGRRVPVPKYNLGNVLAAGYAHTDQIVYSDDPADRTPPPQPAQSATEVLAQFTKTMMEQNNLKEIAELLNSDPSAFARLKELLDSAKQVKTPTKSAKTPIKEEKATENNPK